MTTTMTLGATIAAAFGGLGVIAANVEQRRRRALIPVRVRRQRRR